MSETSEEAMEISEPSIEYFATSILPLFHGPLVNIHIQPSNRKYTVSKSLLCTESEVFTSMFQGSFRESQEQTATLQEIDGVLSIQSFEALLQWIYLRIIRFDLESPREKLSAAIELARLAGMYGISPREYIYRGHSKSVESAHSHNQTHA
ncbi:BTB/POZ fold [Penicillium camemberti]|uniref:BTB/POZ fold n=1 Tax=Penicillium camemberti (strain FM 013) TaxID=1429867 RepID=A0A0G4PL77_PENC3|nr:BTB/POZ fold [Penicillium camemberti]